MPLKFIVIAVNENTFIVVTSKIKISALIIFLIYIEWTKQKEKKNPANIPETNSKNKPENFISRYFGFD